MSRDPTHQRPDRNLALELVRVTEAAAMSAARWIGRGEKNAADQAAVDAMRLMLATVAAMPKDRAASARRWIVPMVMSSQIRLFSLLQGEIAPRRQPSNS